MRYKPGHKEQTHRRIVEEAGRLFREGGYGSTGIPKIMEAAGLTVGGFYSHFESKEALLRESLEALFHEMRKLRRDNLGELSDEAWLRAFADWYLSTVHRDHRGQGCPLPVLSVEIPQAGDSVQDTFERLLSAFVDEVAERVSATDPSSAKQRATAFVAMSVGALMLSRAVKNEDNADDILDACRQTALMMLDASGNGR